MALRLMLQLVSTTLIGAAVGGGITYKVLVSNRADCSVVPPPASSTMTKFLEAPPAPMTGGARY